MIRSRVRVGHANSDVGTPVPTRGTEPVEDVLQSWFSSSLYVRGRGWKTGFNPTCNRTERKVYAVKKNEDETEMKVIRGNVPDREVCEWANKEQRQLTEMKTANEETGQKASGSLEVVAQTRSSKPRNKKTREIRTTLSHHYKTHPA